MTTSLQQALKTHFGFDSFRTKLQEDVVKAVLTGESVSGSFIRACRLCSSGLIELRKLANSNKETFNNKTLSWNYLCCRYHGDCDVLCVFVCR